MSYCNYLISKPSPQWMDYRHALSKYDTSGLSFQRLESLVDEKYVRATKDRGMVDRFSLEYALEMDIDNPYDSSEEMSLLREQIKGHAHAFHGHP